ncbi:DUF6545 domain-containing protein, partial [Micromonospora nigra]|uniref:DUF6545 domain-containing protein n=1 Tax=Micromonospora nigra TaxID=145857 RepID=UPI001C318988
VEILDGILALRPYRDPDAEQRLRAQLGEQSIEADQVDARVEAAMIEHALNARRLGQPAGRPHPVPPKYR